MKPTLQPDEMKVFMRLLRDAFAEALAHVEQQVAAKVTVPRHRNFPTISRSQNEMPSMMAGYHPNPPPDYGALFKGEGPFGFLMRELPADAFPKAKELTNWMQSVAELREYFVSEWSNDFSDVSIHLLIVSAVDRYINLFNTTSFFLDKYLKVVIPLVKGIVDEKLDVSIVVPIAITLFDFDHVRLNDDCYIFKMSDAFQLSRFRAEDHGSGASSNVKDAATHAFVSKNWELGNEGRHSLIGTLLRNASAFPTEKIDTFFAALRCATGRDTGYAQMLIVPRRWVHNYYVNLPCVHGVTVRKYPGAFDNYGWTRSDLTPVTSEEIGECGRLFQLLTDCKENKIRIAIRRLNSCSLRDNPEDALIDATVGLEVLLSDGDSQAISYKLGLRAGALARLDPAKQQSPHGVQKAVKKLYSKRSAIVHGHTRKEHKRKVEATDGNSFLASDRAIELLRYALLLLLDNPKYLDPKKIDAELLLGNDNQ